MIGQQVYGLLLRRLVGISTSSLSDAARNLKPKWPTVQTLGAGVNPVHKVDKNTKLLGRALTVKCEKDNYGGLVNALHHMSNSKDSLNYQDVVICVDTCGSTKAVAGSLFAAELHRLRVKGLVVDGNIRDVAGIRVVGNQDRPFPVFARGVNPTAGKGDQLGEVQVQILMGDDKVTVNGGDVILGDDDGVVAVNLTDCGEEILLEENEQISLVAELLDEAERIENREERVLKQSAKGTPLLDCV